MENIESIRQKIAKVHALAQHGIGGEAENAKAHLDRLLKKYGVTLDEISQPVEKLRKFTFQTKYEKQLLGQIYCMIKNVNNYQTWGYANNKKSLGLKMTDEEYIDFCEYLIYYKDLLRKETETLFHAFLGKHNLFSQIKNEGESEISDKELAAILAMMKSLNGETMNLKLKQIGG